MLNKTGTEIIKKPVRIGRLFKGPAFAYTPDGHVAYAVMQPPSKDMLKIQKGLLKYAKKLQKTITVRIEEISVSVGSHPL